MRFKNRLASSKYMQQTADCVVPPIVIVMVLVANRFLVSAIEVDGLWTLFAWQELCILECGRCDRYTVRVNPCRSYEELCTQRSAPQTAIECAFFPCSAGFLSVYLLPASTICSMLHCWLQTMVVMATTTIPGAALLNPSVRSKYLKRWRRSHLQIS